MGFNTQILVLNDALGKIEENPEEFTEAVVRMARSREPMTASIGNHANPVMSVGTAHADQTRIIHSRGNYMTDLADKRFNLDEKSEKERDRIREKAEVAKEEIDALLESLDDVDEATS